MRQANRDASTKRIARRHTNVIHARNRFAEARRRRETASWAEIEAISLRIPQGVRHLILKAVFTATSENSPDAFAPLPSPWRERLLPLPERPMVPVVDLTARRTAAKEATK